jgi:hypothetical protein
VLRSEISVYFPGQSVSSKKVVLLDLQSAQLVASFNDYFVQKITRIRKNVDDRARLLPPEHYTDKAASSFATFSPVSDVEQIVSLASGASCIQFLLGSLNNVRMSCYLS